jgi:hypothetical protein
MISAIATIAYFTAGIYAQCGAPDCFNFTTSYLFQTCATYYFLKDPIIVACINETGFRFGIPDMNGIYSN